MPSPRDLIDAMSLALTTRYGRPDPFPAAVDVFEAILAVVLDRGMEESKRHKAIEAFRDAAFLDPQVLAEADPTEVGETLRTAGLKIQDKALVPLIRLARWVVELHHGNAEALSEGPDAPATEQLREELMALRGVGPATADAILLLALRRPVYPVDRATYRIFVRHGWLDTSSELEEARDTLTSLAPDEPERLGQLSIWFERVARDYCRAGAPRCEKCPLRPWLPEGGAISHDDFAG